MASQKVDFAQACKNAAQKVYEAEKACEDVYEVFWDRGYNSGGANALTPEDISSTEITPTMIGDFTNFCDNFQKFLNNQSITQSDWDSIINKIREI